MNENFNSIEILNRLNAIKNQQMDDKYSQRVDEIKYKPKADPGKYPGFIKDISLEKNSMSYLGINDKLTVSYTILKFDENGNVEEVDINKTYWKSNSENSSYYKALKELLMRDPRKGFILKELLGITCEVYIEHNESEKGVFANITSIKRVSLDNSMTSINI